MQDNRKLPFAMLNGIFKWLCKPDYFEELRGDLEEGYHYNLVNFGEAYARKIYLRELLLLIRPSVIRKLESPNINPTFMIANYLKTSFRSMGREKLFSIVNISGLSIGIAAFLILLIYAYREFNYDSSIPDREAVFRLALDQVHPTTGELQFQNAVTFYGIGLTVKEEVPEVKHVVQLFSTNGIFEIDENLQRSQKTFFTSSSFFDVFARPMLRGESKDLDKVNTIFLSESTANAFFGDIDPIGKRITFNAGLRNKLDLEVRGVFQDFPPNSHIKTNALISSAGFENMVNENEFFGPQLKLPDVIWRWMQFYTYVEVHPGTDVESLKAKLTAFVLKHRKPFDEQQGRLSHTVLQPVNAIHLDSSRSGELETPGSRKLAQFLIGVAILIMVVAWINYVNLSTAKAINRAKEVGVRKVVGAFRSQLRVQFLSESLIMNVAALALAIGLVILLSPYLTDIIGSKLVASELSIQSIGLVIAIIIVGALLAGIYPAMILSSYRPITVLKGKMITSKKGALLRKGLVTFQFVIAIFMLCAVYAVHSQLDYMTRQDMGIRIDSTIVVQRPPIAFNQAESQEKMETFRDRLLELSNVSDVTISSHAPGAEIAFKQTCFMRGEQDKSLLLSRLGVSSNYHDFFNVPVLTGRFFIGEQRGGVQQVVVNEKLVQDFGFKSNDEIIGKSIEFPGGMGSEIIGVIANFHHRGLRFPVDPIVIHHDSASNGQLVAIRLKKNDLTSVRELYRTMFPNTLFEASFLDDAFSTIYNEDRRFKNIVTIFTGVAITIACLGLLGLASYLLSQRVKEVCVRKVLGAQSPQLFGLLMKDYAMLTMASAIIALPLAYLAINQWLRMYATQVDLKAWAYIVPPIGLFALVVLTIGYQTINATRINPAERLKVE